MWVRVERQGQEGDLKVQQPCDLAIYSLSSSTTEAEASLCLGKMERSRA